MYQHELDIASEAACKAGQIAMGYWNRGVAAENKADDSPVTVADRESERAIAGLLEEAFPDDGMLGEEGARKASRSGRRWIIDPIDGTRDFLRGNRAWAVLIALEEEGQVVAGVAYLPAVEELYTASRGRGARCNGSIIRASGISTPGQAVLCVNGFNILSRYPFNARLQGWMERFWAVRSFGGCLDAMMIARGQADLWIEPAAKAWDLAPLKILVEEAGGCFFNFDGGSSIHAGNCVCCAPGLEAEARGLVCVY
ncbi:MAG: hypothetical protein HYR60_32765 [Acidobacteria bacterium]|nr:hypothetical protein [Acidobacteriota bacterium]